MGETSCTRARSRSAEQQCIRNEVQLRIGTPDFLAGNPDRIDLDKFDLTMIWVQFEQPERGYCVELRKGSHHDAGIFRCQLRVAEGEEILSQVTLHIAVVVQKRRLEGALIGFGK